MATYTYDDVRLVFEPTAEARSYRVLAIDAAAGAHADGRFVVPIGDEEIVDLGRRSTREASRDVGEPAGDATADVHGGAEEIGRRLADALLVGPVGDVYATARRRVESCADRGVRLSLSLAKAPQLLGVPWELLFVRPRFLASQQRTPIVRLLETNQTVAAVTLDGPLRILGVVASPRGAAPLDVAAERARVDGAVGPMRDAGRVEIEWLHPATPGALRTALRDGAFHVLHFVGHSDFTAAGDGVILLERVDGTAVEVDETLLANLVADQSATLRLVVLNSCKGGRTTAADPQAGVAATLMALGLPAVVAMQFAISDRAAIAFAGELYTGLVDRRQPLDAALGEARKAVYTDISATEWATPVLFLRDPTAPLFSFPASAAPGDAQPGDGGGAATTISESGAVAIGGNVTISGGQAAGRDLVIGDRASTGGGNP